jgi:hypothetical protein
MNCAGPCERLLVAWNFVGPLPLGTARVKSHGLCGADYAAARRRDALEDYRRVYRRRADIVEDTAELAEQRLTRAEIARRLGLKPDSLYQAHRRAGVPCPV